MKRRLLAIVLVVGALATSARGDEEQQTPPEQTAPTPPPASSDEITVTATRTESRVADTPASVVVIGREDVGITAAATIDDVLRQVPGFTLFRRTGSRVANPTSQGVSLRGIGASGASRALVLDDGIPLNDPFGGWIYWSRVPRRAIERLEIVRGGASELYGSSAMGGVIQFVRRRDASIAAEVSGGSQSTAIGSMYASGAIGSWRGSIGVNALDTAGYVLVESSQRGAIDREADTNHVAVDATIARERVFLRASQYDESRNNGTPLQVNDTTIRQIAFGADLNALSGTAAIRGWLGEQDYRQTFSAIAADRQSERLTVDQSVPSESIGASAQWSRTIDGRHALLAGADWREVNGTSDETAFAFNGTTSRTATFGRQRSVGAFIENIFIIAPAISVTAGLRLDSWRNVDAERNGLPLAEQSESAWSPRLALLYRPTARLGFSASAYRAFRAPTLNELYRGFRVGNVLTLANESLGAERLTGFEVGVRAANIRATLFHMSVDDAVANVTLSTTPQLITRQRQNVATSVSRGAEIEGDWRIGTEWRASAGYLYTDARATSGSLDGRRLPQVPQHQATAQVSYSAPVTMAIQTRWSSAQFDDDLNTLRLDGYFVVDAFASRDIARGLAVTLAAENIFDTAIEASATPVVTLGQPRAIRVGLRYER